MVEHDASTIDPPAGVDGASAEPPGEAAGEPGAVAAVAAIRAHFPALARRHGGQLVAYFDGPGGTQVPEVVVAAMRDHLLQHNANTRWAYPTSEETDAALAAARRTFADYLGGAPEEVVFGANMTTLTLHLGRALGRLWSAGDVLVVTELDHHANADSWRALARERGLEVRTVRMERQSGRIDEEDFRRQVTPGVRLVAFTAASNALGTLSDVPRLVELAHQVGALAFVDAVHYAAHLPPDVRGWGCDFLVCSPYKLYGPHLGVLWGRRELLERLDPPRLEGTDGSAPFLLETGTLPHENIVGAAAAVDFLASLAVRPGSRRERLLLIGSELHRRGAALLRQLWEGLEEVAGIDRHGPPPESPRTPTLAFTLAGQPARAVAVALAEQGLFLSHGHFLAVTVTRLLGHERDGLVRAGCAAYTTAEEVARLVAAVRGLAAARSG